MRPAEITNRQSIAQHPGGYSKFLARGVFRFFLVACSLELFLGEVGGTSRLVIAAAKISGNQHKNWAELHPVGELAG